MESAYCRLGTWWNLIDSLCFPRSLFFPAECFADHTQVCIETSYYRFHSKPRSLQFSIPSTKKEAPEPFINQIEIRNITRLGTFGYRSISPSKDTWPSLRKQSSNLKMIIFIESFIRKIACPNLMEEITSVLAIIASPAQWALRYVGATNREIIFQSLN